MIGMETPKYQLRIMRIIMVQPLVKPLYLASKGTMVSSSLLVSRSHEPLVSCLVMWEKNLQTFPVPKRA